MSRSISGPSRLHNAMPAALAMNLPVFHGRWRAMKWSGREDSRSRAKRLTTKRFSKAASLIHPHFHPHNARIGLPQPGRQTTEPNSTSRNLSDSQPCGNRFPSSLTASIKSAISVRLSRFRQRLDELPNVFGTPGGASRGQLNRLWKAARFDAFPPTRLPKGNDA